MFFLQDKSETQGTLKRFLRRDQNKFELKVKKIRSDNGSEFKNLQVEEYLEEEGVKHEFSAPYTPQQNGVVERKNRTLIDMARMMLGEFKTPERVWSEAMNTLHSLHTTSKWCGREEEQDAYRHGKDDAWRVEDARAVLVGSCEHSLPHHKPAISASPPQEDLLQTPSW